MSSPKKMSAYPIQLFKNPHCEKAAPYGNDLKEILSLENHHIAAADIRSWPGYAPTPLRRLDGLANEAGVDTIHYKDEASRFGLGSFKALGGAYAVYRLLAEEVKHKMDAEQISPQALATGKYQEITSQITVTCATAGNHGRSVAWGARMFGCGCVIYLSLGVSQGREDAIASYGAEIVRIGSTYDESVLHCDSDASKFGRFVISDTSYPGYMDVPRRVMQGYTIMTEEALEVMPRAPTHVFVQGGVGGLAASVCAYIWESLGAERPRSIVVEPDKADCLFQSAKAGKPAKAKGNLDTVMAGLSCAEVSLLAWDILSVGTDYFTTIQDESSWETMRLLADSPFGDKPIVGGESGVAGLAGFIAASQDEKICDEIGLDERSRVLVYGTEGATDPEIYEQIVGRPPEVVS